MKKKLVALLTSVFVFLLTGGAYNQEAKAEDTVGGAKVYGKYNTVKGVKIAK